MPPLPPSRARPARCRRLGPPALLLGGLLAGCAGLGPGGPAGGGTDTPARPEAAGPEPPPWERTDRDRAIQHLLAAEIAARRGQLDRALEAYLAAMALTPDQRVAERAVELSLVLEDEGRARAAAQRWRELAPEQAEAYQLLGLLALRRGDGEAARQALGQAVERWPGTPGQAFLQLIGLLGPSGDPEVALRTLSDLAEAYPEVSEAHRAVAVAAERADGPARALAAAERAFRLAPSDREAGKTLLRAVSRARRADAVALEAALATLQRLREAQPELRPQAALVEGEILRRAGRLAEAEAAYGRGLAEAPGDVELLYGRGLARAGRGEVDGALADLRRVLEAEPDAAYVLNALGYTLADSGRDLDRARELIGRALEAEPDNPAFLDSQGWLLYREGRLAEARERLERAFEQQPHAEIGAHLGEVLWELGERERARAVWQRAYEQGPEHRVLRETLERYGVEPDAWQ